MSSGFLGTALIAADENVCVLGWSWLYNTHSNHLILRRGGGGRRDHDHHKNRSSSGGSHRSTGRAPEPVPWLAPERDVRLLRVGPRLLATYQGGADGAFRVMRVRVAASRLREGRGEDSGTASGAERSGGYSGGTAIALYAWSHYDDTITASRAAWMSGRNHALFVVSRSSGSFVGSAARDGGSDRRARWVREEAPGRADDDRRAGDAEGEEQAGHEVRVQPWLGLVATLGVPRWRRCERCRQHLNSALNRTHAPRQAPGDQIGHAAMHSPPRVSPLLTVASSHCICGLFSLHLWPLLIASVDSSHCICGLFSLHLWTLLTVARALCGLQASTGPCGCGSAHRSQCGTRAAAAQ